MKIFLFFKEVFENKTKINTNILKTMNSSKKKLKVMCLKKWRITIVLRTDTEKQREGKKKKRLDGKQ